MTPELYLQCLTVSLFVLILALKMSRFFMITARTNPLTPNTSIAPIPKCVRLQKMTIQDQCHPIQTICIQAS